MKTNFFKLVSTSVLCSAILFTTGCKNEEEFLNEAPQPEATRPAKLGVPTKFDQVKFAGLIEEYLEPQVAGFGYAIYNDGVEYYQSNGGDGWARKPFDFLLQAHGAKARQETMNVTQFVTATAVIKALETYNVPLSAKVFNYLPTKWVPSAKFKELSFERLLSHKTGLINHNGGLNTLRQTVEGPLNDQEFQQNIRDDDDVNYELLAVILPYVQAVTLSKQGNSTMLNNLNNIASDADLFKTTAMHYREFVRFNVFIPAGLSDPYVIAWRAWEPSGNIDPDKGTKGYPAKAGEQPGIPKADNNVNCGATGLYLSAAQFAKMQSAVAQFRIISFNGLAAMKQNLFGFDGKLVGTKGNYYWKKGNGRNCETIIFDFGKIQVAVFANSQESQISSPSVLGNFFEQSLIPL